MINRKTRCSVRFSNSSVLLLKFIQYGFHKLQRSGGFPLTDILTDCDIPGCDDPAGDGPITVQLMTKIDDTRSIGRCEPPHTAAGSAGLNTSHAGYRVSQSLILSVFWFGLQRHRSGDPSSHHLLMLIHR
jgi:hypothetical protein